MRSALLPPKTRARCAHLNVSSVAALCAKRRKASITTQLLRRAKKDGAENRAGRHRNWSRGYRAIRRAATAAVTPNMQVAAGIFGTLPGTIVFGEGRIGDIADF